MHIFRHIRLGINEVKVRNVDFFPQKVTFNRNQFPSNFY